jgi:hypothetical protein
VTEVHRRRAARHYEWWVAYVSAEITVFADQLAMARAARDLDEPSQATAGQVQARLQLARAALERPKGLTARWDRWLGAPIDAAFVNLHAAKTLLVDLLPDPEIDAMAPTAARRLLTVLPVSDPRRSQLAWLLRSPRPEVRRAALRDALQIGYRESDRRYARIRSFRNVLMLSSVLLTALTIAIAALSAWRPGLLPLCFHPPSPTQADVLVCPSGVAPEPFPLDATLVALLGAMGGAVSAVQAVRYVGHTSTPYAVPAALALLKVSTGAATAILGLLLLSAGFVPGLSQLETQPQILAYALVFGFAQQLFTRFVDQQGAALLSEVPARPRAESVEPALEPPSEPVAGDIRKALDESVQASIENTLSRPVVTNVQGALHVSSHVHSSDHLEVTVRLTTGLDHWRRAAEAGDGRPFRLTGGQDRPTAAFEILIDAAGLRASPERASLELATDNGANQWISAISGDRDHGAPIWVTLYSSGRYVQAMRLVPDAQVQPDGQQ